MKTVKTGIGNFQITCFYGEEEFEKYAKIEQQTTEGEKPSYNRDCKGLSCLNAIWVYRGDDPVILAHELIHYLFILHSHIGAKEIGVMELFAYQHTYLMLMFYLENNKVAK